MRESLIIEHVQREAMQDLIAKNPNKKYRITSANKLQMLTGGKTWRNICNHGKQIEFCNGTDCGATGTALCKHGKQKHFCTDIECPGGAICKHGKQAHFCLEERCPGSAICKHGKQAHFCLEEGCPGSALCVHEIQRAKCVDEACHGGSQICCACKIHAKQLDGYCLTCHPEYEVAKGCSRVACKFIDDLEKARNIKIQHRHFNLDTLKFSGLEHRPINWKRKAVDGYYVDVNGQKFAFEFLGDIYHGHRRLWENNNEATNHLGYTYESLYYNTLEKLQKLQDLDYHVYFIWESDYKSTGLEKMQLFDGVI